MFGSMMAGGVNCFLMRMREAEGVKVYNKDGIDLGVSAKAGWIVLQSMSLTRVCLSMFCTGIPVFCVILFSRGKL